VIVILVFLVITSLEVTGNCVRK